MKNFVLSSLLFAVVLSSVLLTLPLGSVSAAKPAGGVIVTLGQLLPGGNWYGIDITNLGVKTIFAFRMTVVCFSASSITVSLYTPPEPYLFTPTLEPPATIYWQASTNKNALGKNEFYAVGFYVDFSPMPPPANSVILLDWTLYGNNGSIILSGTSYVPYTPA